MGVPIRQATAERPGAPQYSKTDFRQIYPYEAASRCPSTNPSPPLVSRRSTARGGPWRQIMGAVWPWGMLVGKCRHGVVVDTLTLYMRFSRVVPGLPQRDRETVALQRLSVFPHVPKERAQKGTAALDARFDLNLPALSADGCYRTRYAGDTKREVRYDAMSPHFDARLVSPAGSLPRAIVDGILVRCR